MTEVVLILEHAPTPQRETRRIYHGGQMTIGRGDDADWRLDDPDMFVSRKHCVISDETGAPMATDASTGGLFFDGGAQALGAGNSMPLENDMRLRLGDFVIRVEIAAVRAQRATSGRGMASAFEFGAPTTPEPPKERPKDLPKPFGQRTDDRPFAREETAKPHPRPLDELDPFALDLAPRRIEPDARPEPERQPERSAPLAGGRGYFCDPPPAVPPHQDAPRAEPSEDPFGPALQARAPDLPGTLPFTAPVQEPPASPHGASPSDAAVRAAFYRGLGINLSRLPPEDAEAEMEALGQRFRALADGLVHLLRTRAKEKQKVRVAQTIIGAANVNPLKFAVAPDDAVDALLSPKGQGYLSPDDAIAQSYRDLADHQVRTWAALQSALRRMIDRFDPEEIERELEQTGRLKTLMAGGRNAKLWQLYVERYRDIARAAEERFLGEVGADFRDAYEDNRRTRDDN